ncbi:MAG: lipid-binding SYLF domain-containing protein [Acidobacteriota bacterium]|jgi:lipid-binding SYLF domain-containing protein
MSKLRAACFGLVVLVSIQSFIWADTKEERERLKECAEVTSEVLGMPEGIPQDLLDKAECVVVIPSVKKFALGIGGSYGKGAMVCRSGSNFRGPWGAPAMMRLEGGSFGLQIGGSATDFILLVMNAKGADSLLKSKVKLGADASIAAGPEGRTATASTDALMTAEILSYSRSKGLFAGVSLAGSTLRQDSGANQDLYGRKISARQIVLEHKVKTPPEGAALVKALEEHSPKNLSK